MSSYPTHLNVSNVRGFADAQTSRSTALVQMQDGVTQISGSSDVAQWQTSAAETFRIRLARIIQLTSDVSTVSSKWATSAATYADQLESMASRGQQAEYDIQRGISQRQGLSHVPPDMLPDGQWARRMEDAEELINHGNMVLGNLHYERSGIDGEFARALSFAHGSGLTVQWMQLATMYNGARTAQDILDRRGDLLNEALDLAAAVAKRPANPDDIAALAAALRNASADPNLSSQFWLEVGGDETLPLLEAGLMTHANQGGMGYPTDEDRDAALAFARSVRESLASGSQLWNTEQGQDFAAHMLTGADWPGDSGRRLSGIAGVGFLFDDADRNPMGRSFTVAAADIFDTWERTEQTGGEPWGSSGMDPLDPYGVFDSIAIEDQVDRGGAYDSNVGESRYGAGVRDPFGRVLDTLGTYPDAAWEWLNDNSSTLHDGSHSVAGDRVDYLSRRDWSADGWDGFGSLWEGSMHAEGGLASDGYSSSTWETQGDAAARIVAGLDSTGYVTVESLSEAGGANLGDALGRLMVFAEFQGYSDLGQPGTGDPLIVEVANPQGNDPTRAMPYLEQNSFGDLVSAVSATDNGFSSLRLAVTEVQNSLLYAANESGSYEAWDDALGRYAQLEANFQGAVGGADVMEARLADDAIRQRMEVVSVATSFLPGSGLVGGLGAVVDSATGIGAGGLVDVITDGLAQNEAMAQSLLPTFEGAGAAGVDLKISGMENDPALNLSEVEVGEKSRETWLNSFSQRYEDGYYASVWRSTDTH